MNYKTRFTLIAVALVGLALVSPAVARPNIVFIMTDDQAHDAVGYKARYPFLKTPNIDRLAKEGAVFENFFVSTSLCSPSRAAMLTGTYGHLNGVTYNEQSDPKLPTFPGQLQEAGYETAYIGKWHMEFHARPRLGFDHWISFKGQGTYFDPKLNINGEEKKIKGYTTDILTKMAADWMTEERNKEKSFCLFLMHKANHDPMSPAPRHEEVWPDAELQLPASATYDMADRPAWQRHSMRWGAHNEAFHANCEKPTPKRLPAKKEWDPEMHDKLVNHLRCILAVDDSVGQIYKTLEELGELDNTLFIFTADNGYFLGEHRRNDKRLAYEESIRVPFTARYPKMIKPGTTIQAQCINIDIAPTFCELAGSDKPDQFQGRSLIPVFSGNEPAEWREYIFYQYFQEHYAPGYPTMLAIRTDHC